MNSKERIKMALAHQEPDRVPIQDSPWAETIARWHKEGLSDGITPAEYFGYELAMFGADTTPRFPVKTIEKTDKYIIQTTPTGAINKNFWDHTSTPGLVDRPIKKKEDWLSIKERLYPDYTRVDWVSTFNNYHIAQSEGKFICYSSGYGYDTLQSYIRSDQLLVAMVDDPEWTFVFAGDL